MNYLKLYTSIIDSAKQRTSFSGRCEVHHIKPTSLGGEDVPENLVKLSLREHFVCHLLLAKIYGGPMLTAAFMMSSRKCNNSKSYSWLREKHITENMMGDNNPSRRIPCTEKKRELNSKESKDRKWLNNGVESRMAKGEKMNDLLQNGWVLGRLLTDTLIAGARYGGLKTGGNNRGKPCSQEQRAAISATLTGRPSWNKGKHIWSEEQIEKMKEARRGKPTSKETKEKQSVALKKYWELKRTLVTESM